MLTDCHVKVPDKETLRKIAPYITKAYPQDIEIIGYMNKHTFITFPVYILFTPSKWMFSIGMPSATEIPIKVILEPENYPEYYL